MGEVVFSWLYFWWFFLAFVNSLYVLVLSGEFLNTGLFSCWILLILRKWRTWIQSWNSSIMFDGTMNYFELPLCEFLLLVSVTRGGEEWILTPSRERGWAAWQSVKIKMCCSSSPFWGVPRGKPPVFLSSVWISCSGCSHRGLFYLCIKGWSKGRTVSKKLSLVLL